MNLEASKKIMSSVCAIGYFKRDHEEDAPLTLPDDLVVVGTGFLVNNNLVCTNNHVLHAMCDFREKVEDWHLVFFDNLSNIQRVNAPNAKQFFSSPLRDVDVGFIEIDLGSDKSSYSVPDFYPLADLHPGLSVGVIGFPRGKDSLDIKLKRKGYLDTVKLKRHSSLLHAGVISGLSPFQLNFYEKSHVPGYMFEENVDFSSIHDFIRIITNISLSPGFSGAPLIDLESGSVIGIHSASIKYEGGQDGAIGISFGLSRESIDQLIPIFWAFKKDLCSYPDPDYDIHFSDEFIDGILAEMREVGDDRLITGS